METTFEGQVQEFANQLDALTDAEFKAKTNELIAFAAKPGGHYWHEDVYNTDSFIIQPSGPDDTA